MDSTSIELPAEADLFDIAALLATILVAYKLDDDSIGEVVELALDMHMDMELHASSIH